MSNRGSQLVTEKGRSQSSHGNPGTLRMVIDKVRKESPVKTGGLGILRWQTAIVSTPDRKVYNQYSLLDLLHHNTLVNIRHGNSNLNFLDEDSQLVPLNNCILRAGAARCRKRILSISCLRSVLSVE